MTELTAPPRPRPAPIAGSPALAPPPGHPRFALFDSLRAIAVVAVVTFHVASITGALDTRVIGDVLGVLGNQGLILFFVISGFLLYRPFVSARVSGRTRPSTARYARRRALRIVPAYWTALTVLAVFPGIVGVFSGDWWRYYLFAQLYSNRSLGGGIPVAWTLCVEVSFYAALPLWAALMRMIGDSDEPRRRLRAELAGLALLSALGVIVQTAASRQAISYQVSDSLLGQCTWFALGMALAVTSVATAEVGVRFRPVTAASERPGLCWIGAVVSLAGVAAVLRPGGAFTIVLSLRTEQPFARTLGAIALTAGVMTLLVAPAVFGDRAGGLPRRLLCWRPLAWIGLVSYGIYLWHLTIAELLGISADPLHFSAGGLGLAQRIHHLTTPILFVIVLAASVAIATLSYYVVELPFLRLKERR